MAINFPTSLDVFTDPTSSDQLNLPSHSGQHTDLNNAVEALEAKVGINSSAVTSSHDYKIAQLEARNTAGLVLLDATDFTTASSVSVDNVFSSTYSNYVIMFSSSDASATAGYLRFRLRASGVDESSGSNYYRYNRQFTYTSTSGQDGGNYTFWDIGEVSSAWPDTSSFQMTLWNPAVAQRTTGYTISHKASSTVTNVQQTVASLHKLQTAYDGFTLYSSTGTFTGKLRVYGMAES